MGAQLSELASQLLMSFYLRRSNASEARRNGEATRPPNGLELSCPAEAGSSPLLYGDGGRDKKRIDGPARRVSFSELLGSDDFAQALNQLI